MHVFWEVVASNALMVVVLAAGIAVLGRVWKNPVALHVLWIFVLLKLFTPPLVTVSIPLPASSAALTTEEHAESHAKAVALGAEASRPQPLSEGKAADGRPALALDAMSPAVQREGMSWLTVLAWTWGVGIALFAFVRAACIFWFMRLLRMAEPASPVITSMAEGVARRLGLRRVPRIVMLPVRLSPMVWSLGGRPRVVLPSDLFASLDAAAQETILAHELAHIRRTDHWVRLLELVATTLFWWHPVVWWGARRLQELEDQCCDGMVLDMAPQGAKTYATALLDTLDFLSERSVAVPLGAAAANRSTFLARRIAMLKNPPPVMRLSLGQLALLVALAAVPMTVAWAGKPDQAGDQASADKSVVQRRAVNKLVKDFPEKDDFSTPESAWAAYERAWARLDAKAVCEMGAWKFGPRDVRDIEKFMKHDAKDLETYRQIVLGTEAVEVLTYRGDFVDVISKIKLPKGVGRDPYSSRSFGKINGVWKNLGEDRLPSLEAAREAFDRKKEHLWENYMKVLDGIKKGKPVSLGGGQRHANFAPGAPMGISVEKADLMGRVEWAMMHGGRDITARKSIEWGDVKKDEDGNRTIRYKFYATIWDKDVYVMNKVFTFDAKGNILGMEDVEGFPQKKVEKPVNVSTPAGMKELVEDFFSKNFRDVTARKTIEWGEVTKAKDGNSSIRYKYRATIWNKDIKIMNQIFTFDPKGKFVSVKDVDGFPQNQ